MRIALRSAKNPWDAVSPLANYRYNTFGNNVGNLVFSEAVHRALSTARAEVESNRFVVSAIEADRLNAESDVFVVPLANAFRPSFADALERLTQMIERLTIPVVVAGVAAQGTVDYDSKRLRNIEPIVKRFVAAVLDRSATIGVRGEFTADYLRQLGFSAVDVIGCPAMFMWGSNLEVTRKVTDLGPDARLSLGVSPYLKAMGPVLDHHLQRYRDLTYIAQDRDTLGALVIGRSVDHPRFADAPVRTTHQAFVEDKIRFFVDPRPWLNHLRQRDYYVGSRIHGSMIALLAGTPATVLVHDSRTRELAEFHRIPHRRLGKIAPTVDAAELYREMRLDSMSATHQANFTNYLGFLERNNLPHIWTAGESPAVFDRQVAAAPLAAPVRAPRPARRIAQQIVIRAWSTGRRTRRLSRSL
jgi:Polysaccharide pyruvyl transferase